MRIRNISGLTSEDLQKETDKGGRFIYYGLTISLILFSIRRKSGVFLIRKGENAVKKGLPYIILTGLLGWWAIPNGPKLAFQSIKKNLKGGHDVTDDVMATIAGHELFRQAEKEKKLLKQDQHFGHASI